MISKIKTCPVCIGSGISIFLEITQVPVHCNLLWPTREEALGVSKGDILLAFCRSCGHVFNVAFDPNCIRYCVNYENSLHFSPRFQEYARSLALRLVERYDLYKKDIIEIGCGQGDFLISLCDLGENRGVGFDPGYRPGRSVSAPAKRITFVQDFYSERYANYKADLICSRHVLEHIQFPRDFLFNLRQAIGNRYGTIVFFEVPNVIFTLRDLGIWDLIYEHCSYFSMVSLAHLFISCEFEVCDLTETFEGQFLSIEAEPAKDPVNAALGHMDELEEMSHYVSAFAHRYRTKVETWHRELERTMNSREKVIIWGAGSKGVTFLNTLRVQEEIKYVIDINPQKQGNYVAGTGQHIMPPEFLTEYMPDLVIVMNPIYLEEVRQYINSLDLSPNIISA